MSYISNGFIQFTSSEIDALTNLTDLAPSGVGQFLRKTGYFTFENATPSEIGMGDVLGPNSAISDNIAVFNGVSGKLIKDGGYKISDLATVTSLANYLPLAGGTMTGNILMTSNKLIGGSTTTSDLFLQTTTGVGTTGADMHFLVGNNGGTEAMTILNSGNVGIGTTNPTAQLEIKNLTTNTIALKVSPVGNSHSYSRFDKKSGYDGGILLSKDNVLDYQIVNIDNRNLRIYSYSAGNSALEIQAATGNVGIGTTNPTAVLHLKAGTATASTAPLKFTSGILNTTAEAGAVEFLTDIFYGTRTTAAARVPFTMGSGTINEIPYWVDANTLGTLAVATYPSLTELSYVKGVTSAVQTQLNSKLTSANIEDSIVDGHTTIAPSGNAVFDALALKDTKTDLTKYSNLNLAEGQMINGKIVPSVASNNLTVALKGMDGNDPSATNPVYVRIAGVVRAITSALSVTKNAATNWCNAGSAELATKEIDYFTYLGYNATDGVVLGFSRIAHATLYSDFSATTTNEKYAGISTITNAAAGDNYVNIGRFAATLSAGAGYTWSVPTFTASNLIQRPIYETRWLTWVATLSTGSGITWTRGGQDVEQYKILGRELSINFSVNATTGAGSATQTLNFTLPFNNLDGAQTNNFATWVYYGNFLAGFAYIGTTSTVYVYKYDGGTFSASTNAQAFVTGAYGI